MTSYRGRDIEGAIAAAGYDVVQLLGEGGMGVVYEAIDQDLGQRVALKVLLSDQSASVYDFKHEFRALADVTHPNLVTFYELRQVDDMWLLSMELVQGLHFLDYMQATAAADRGSQPEPNAAPAPRADLPTVQFSGPIPQSVRGLSAVFGAEAPGPPDLDRLRQAFVQLCDALHALHGSGHIHRDVKPSNVMVTSGGRVVVLDFGIVAALAAKRPLHEQIKGTPLYMAPEQAEHDRVLTPAADWYAVGVMLYEAMTNKPPFVGNTEQLLLAKHLTTVPPSAVPLVPEELKPLAELADELLRTEPEQRPAYEEIRARLDPSLSVRSPTPHVPAFIGRTRELAMLTEAYDAMGAGERVGVLISGDSGMGKSMLVREFLAGLPEPAVTLEGRCYEFESVPYKALDSVIDGLSDHLERLDDEQLRQVLPADLAPLLATFPVLGRLETVEQLRQQTDPLVPALDLQRRAFVALGQLIEQVAARQPLVIVIDDLQFGDNESLPFLAELFSRRGSPLLAIATHRRDAVRHNPLVRAFRALCGEGLRELVLSPFEGQDARELCRQWLGPGQWGPEIEHLLEEAGGNPHLLEGLSLLAAQGQGRIPAGRRLSLHDVVAARCNRLSEQGRKMLDVVSLAGWRVPLRMVTRAGAVSDADVPRLLSELRTGRFVKLAEVGGERCLESYHDSVREVVAAALDGEEHRLLHTRIARALDDDGEWAERHPYALADHYYRGDHRGAEARIVELNEAAGERAARASSFQQAYRHLRQAFEVAQAANIDLARQSIALAAEMCLQTGRDAEAGSHYQQLLQTSVDPLEQAKIRLGWALTYIGRQEPLAAKREVTLGIAAVGQPFPAKLPMQLLHTASRVADAVKAYRRGQPVMGPGAERLRILTSLYLERGLLSYFEQDRWGIVSGVLCAMAPVSRLGPCREQVQWMTYAATTCATAGLRAASERLFRTAAQLSEQLDDPLAATRLRVFKALAVQLLGDAVEAEHELERVLAEESPRLHNVDLFNALGTLCWNLMLRGHVLRIPHLLRLGIDRETLATTGASQARIPSYRSYHGPVKATLGDVEAGRVALAALARSVDLDQADRFRSAQYLAQKTLFHLEAGELGEEVERTMMLFGELALSPSSVAFNMKSAYVGRAYVRMRQLDHRAGGHGSAELLQSALEDLRRASRHSILRSHFHVAQAALWLHQDRLDDAHHELQRAAKLARSIDNVWALFEAQLVWVRLYERRAEPVAAKRALAQARRLSQLHGWPLRTERVEALAREHEAGRCLG